MYKAQSNLDQARDLLQKGSSLENIGLSFGANIAMQLQEEQIAKSALPKRPSTPKINTVRRSETLSQRKARFKAKKAKMTSPAARQHLRSKIKALKTRIAGGQTTPKNYKPKSIRKDGVDGKSKL